MEIDVNSNNLSINEIDSYSMKVRAILLDDNNNILIANYSNVFLFPGGALERGETKEQAIIRELREETGCTYQLDELSYLATVRHFQKDYPKICAQPQNRLVVTHYYIGRYKNILKSKQLLSQRERYNNFGLRMIPINQAKEIIENTKSNNPRYDYFVEEILTILDYYKNMKQSVKKKILFK